MNATLGLLNELDDNHIDWIFRVSSEHTVIASTVVVREDQPIDAIYIVLEGLLAVHVFSLSESEIGRLGPGEIVGDISLLENSLPTASITAIETSLLLEIPRTVISKKLEKDASFAAQFYRALAILNSRRLRERVAFLSEAFQAKLEARQWSDRLPETLRHAVEGFKTLLLRADDEALSLGGEIPEAMAVAAEKGFLDFCSSVNIAIGDSSPQTPSARADFGAIVQREILPFVLLTQTAERFYSKPRGYAGDFLTIEMIYQNRAAGTGRIGPLLDRCFLSSPATAAVRNRRCLLAEEILKTISNRADPAHVTSLACGPAQELFDVFERLENRRRLRASLVDIDLQALAHVADRRDKAKLQNQMELFNANLIYLATGRQKLDLKEQDLIYSIGLIDYFNDKFVVKLLNWIFDRLRSGGRVILGNFHPSNYGKAVMDYVMEWKLIHRSEEDMNRLFALSNFKSPCTRMQFEPEGINLFAECVRQ